MDTYFKFGKKLDLETTRYGSGEKFRHSTVYYN
jgi:hypothetical protein